MAPPAAEPADRTARLNRLGRDPTEALRRTSLSQAEKSIVQAKLTTYFGVEFTKQFLAGVCRTRGRMPRSRWSEATR